MSIAHLLEDFGPGLDLPVLHDDVFSQEASETLRLEAYEEGYKAGWEDAVGANQAEQMQVAADLAQNLRDMSFTYQEACSHVTQSLRGVFDALMEQFLPEVARTALAPKVAEQLVALPLSSDKMLIRLAVAPESYAIMQRLEARLSDKKLQIEEDPSLTAGQVAISFAESEISIDFDSLLEDLREALDAFNYGREQEVSNG